jgi:hypothetical protein
MIYNIQTENILMKQYHKKFSFYGTTVQELLDKINEFTKQYSTVVEKSFMSL